MGLSIDPADLMSYGFVQEKDGIQQRATVKDFDERTKEVTLEFLTGKDDTISYNDLTNIINAQEEDGDRFYSFKAILDHRKKGNKWEVLVDWDHTNSSWEPLSELKLADPVTVARYAHGGNLIKIPGWKWAKKHTVN